jgi:hypothetical protein
MGGLTRGIAPRLVAADTEHTLRVGLGVRASDRHTRHPRWDLDCDVPVRPRDAHEPSEPGANWPVGEDPMIGYAHAGE